MAANWKLKLPLKVEFRSRQITNKKVIIRDNEGWHVTHPDSVRPAVFLVKEREFKWGHDGQRAVSHQRFSDAFQALHPSHRLQNYPWQSSYLWDGERFTLLNSTEGGDSVSAFRVEILPSNQETNSQLRPQVASNGVKLLLCAPDLTDWATYLKDRSPRLSHARLNNIPCLALTWKEQFAETKTTQTVYVAPEHSYLVVGMDFRIDEELVEEIRVEELQQKANIWLPKVLHSKYYTRAESFGEHVVMEEEFTTVDEFQMDKLLTGSLFLLDTKSLPTGTRIADLIKQTVTFVDVVPSEEDLARLRKAITQYLNSKVALRDVLSTLPRHKHIFSEINCGPHSLVTLSTLMGKPASFEEMSTLSGADKEGFTTLAGLVKALNAKGFSTKAFEMNFSELKQAPLPAIIHLNPNHFSVLLKFEEDTAVLLDSPSKINVLPLDEFNKRWSGRVLIANKPDVLSLPAMPAKKG
jgi:hypothetical protein